MNIREAKLRDVDELDDLNKSYFGEFRNYSDEINNPNTIVLVGEAEGKIIAISGLKINDWNNTGLVLNIFVHPENRKAGLGAKLINEVINRAKGLKLRCLIAEAPSESNAKFLFMKIGFRKCGYNDRYYSNSPGEIAEFYSLDLK